MAIYHCSIKPVGRRGGRSVTAAAAYRAGVRITDDRTGEVHDYTRKHGVEYAELVFPSGVNMTREQLWNTAERSEKRKDARVAREFELALPAELKQEQRKELATDFAKSLVDKYGVAADVAIHTPSRNGDQRNHHAHILITTRQVSSQGMMDKTDLEREDKALRAHGKPSGREQIEVLRAEWATMCNAALNRAGQNVQVDHRSLKAQGITRMPTVHLGCAATAMERRGESSRLGDRNREVAQVTAALARQMKAKVQENVQEQIATLGTWKPTAEARKAQATLLSNEAAMQVSSADSPQPAQAEASKEPEAALQGDLYSFDDLMKAGKARRAAQARQEPQDPPRLAHVDTALQEAQKAEKTPQERFEAAIAAIQAEAAEARKVREEAEQAAKEQKAREERVAAKAQREAYDEYKTGISLQITLKKQEIQCLYEDIEQKIRKMEIQYINVKDKKPIFFGRKKWKKELCETEQQLNRLREKRNNLFMQKENIVNIVTKEFRDAHPEMTAQHDREVEKINLERHAQLTKRWELEERERQKQKDQKRSRGRSR